jgi:hypothetical protein
MSLFLNSTSGAAVSVVSFVSRVQHPDVTRMLVLKVF